MQDHDKQSAMASALEDAVREKFLEPGYIPGAEDVAAVIAAQGQWGELPKVSKCVCGWPIFAADTHCAACNKPIDQRNVPCEHGILGGINCFDCIPYKPRG